MAIWLTLGPTVSKTHPSRTISGSAAKTCGASFSENEFLDARCSTDARSAWIVCIGDDGDWAAEFFVALFDDARVVVEPRISFVAQKNHRHEISLANRRRNGFAALRS